MRILVTGGTGHLGRSIVSGLKREGHAVRMLRLPGAIGVMRRLGLLGGQRG
jgi:nucleoside-diphosphate-sugar epimerase